MNPVGRGGAAVRNDNKHGILLSNIGPQLMDMFDMFSTYRPIDLFTATISHIKSEPQRSGWALEQMPRLLNANSILPMSSMTVFI